MFRLLSRTSLVLSALALQAAMAPQAAHANWVPWTYQGWLGTTTVWVPTWRPAWSGGPMTYTAAYPGSVTGFSSGSWGASGSCCSPCGVSCDPCGSVCSPCGAGGCSSGDCGTRYAPEGNTQTPTEQPTQPQTEPTFREPVNEDDFRPVTPREQDTRPDAGSAPDWRSTPDSSIPQGGSTIPQGGSTIPQGGSTVPPGGFGPDRPAPGEPGGSIPLYPRGTDGAETNILEIPNAPVATLKVPRSRVLLETDRSAPVLVRTPQNPVRVESTSDSRVVRR